MKHINNKVNVSVFMQQCVLILKKTWHVNGKPPVYKNSFSLKGIEKWFVSRGVTPESANQLSEMYRAVTTAGK